MRKARPDLIAPPNHSQSAGSVDRQCMVTGEVLGKDRLIRFVLSPDNVIVPDVLGKLPGRGMWVTASQDKVNAAAVRNIFARRLKAKYVIPPDLAAQTGDRLTHRALDILGLARKAGLVISGLTKIDRTVNSPRSKEFCGFIHASDGGPDGAQRLGKLAGKHPVISLFSRDQLSLALGDENVVHAALIKGGLSLSFLKEAERLNRYVLGFFGDISNRTEQRVA